MIKNKVLLFIFLSILIIPQIVQANIYYVTQDGAGSKNGSSIANAWSINDFNTVSNWSLEDNDAKIAPGDIVYLYGTFTQNFIIRGSGTLDKPITVDGINAQILTSIASYSKIFEVFNVQHLVFKNLYVDGQDSDMTGTINRAAVYVREWGSPTGHITIEDSHLKNSSSGIILQGNVTNINAFRNTIENMTYNGVGIYADNYDSDELENYDDCPNYVLIGGTRENGNTFRNIAKRLDGEAVPGQTLGTFGTDIIFSYNHVYADMSDVGAGIYIQAAKRALVEYNTFHGLQAERHRAPINFKCDEIDPYFAEDIIVRFNKIYDVYVGPNVYAQPGYAIKISGRGKNRFIYGNYLKGAGIDINWNWQHENLGTGGDGYFVWGNIINGTQTTAGISLSGSSLNTNIYKNWYIFNNTIYRAVQSHYHIDTPSYSYGICTVTASNLSNILQNVHVKNNIIVDTRPNDNEYINIAMRYLSDMEIDYNHHKWGGQTPQVCFYGSKCTPCAFDGEDLPEGYGTNDSSADPKFSNADNGDFTLLYNSPCKDSGKNLNEYNRNLPIINIQGKQYSFDFALGLDPKSTDWSINPPIVSTTNQNSYGNWDKGAYVFNGITPPSNLRILQ